MCMELLQDRSHARPQNKFIDVKLALYQASCLTTKGIKLETNYKKKTGGKKKKKKPKNKNTKKTQKTKKKLKKKN